MRQSVVQRAALAVLCLASLTGCRSEVYLVPHGYTGPVVMMYECPAGELIDTGSRIITFPIGNDGILLVDNKAPPDGWVDMQVYWVDHNGSRTRLPNNRRRSGGNDVHASAFSVGFTRMANGEEFHHETFWIVDPDHEAGDGEVRDALMKRAQKRCRR